MVDRTVIVVGPGGVGKSPLDYLFATDVKINPYRLRPKGPDKNKDDLFYCHPRLKDELSSIFDALLVPKREIGRISWAPVEWFPEARTLLFKVRNQNQVLIFMGIQGQAAKAELYAPLLPIVLSETDLAELFGETEIVVLNPVLQSMTTMSDWRDLSTATEDNCRRRGDSNDDALSRADSVREELEAWKALISSNRATEYTHWPFPEYIYKEPGGTVGLLQHQKNLLKKARIYLLRRNSRLEPFLKQDSQIDELSEPVVK